MFAMNEEVIVMEGPYAGTTGYIDGKWNLSTGGFRYSITGLMVAFAEDDLKSIQ